MSATLHAVLQKVRWVDRLPRMQRRFAEESTGRGNVCACICAGNTCAGVRVRAYAQKCAGYLFVTIICRYMYILRIFASWKKIAKLSTRKHFCHHIRHSAVWKITNCVMFSTVEYAYNSLLIVSAFSFLPSRARARKSDVWWYRWSWELARAKLKLCSYWIMGACCTHVACFT